MPRILTIDDSRAIRMIVSKQVTAMGFEVDEAEDGEVGLARVEDLDYDLILLDVTMPNLDGPGMLAKLRESGNQTPVLMLTSESKRSIVAGLVQLGIEGYILKPFKADDLRAKILKGLRMSEEDVLGVDPSAGGAMTGPEVPNGKQFIDILVVDDMENVQKKLRQLVSEHLSLNGVVSAQAALNQCRERVYRLVLIDYDLPDVSSVSLMRQLRLLQPSAAFLAMALRSNANVTAEAKEQGFDEVLFKPFSAEAIEQLTLQFFDSQELVTRDDDVVTVGAFRGKEDRLDRYYSSVAELIREAAQHIAQACYENGVLDVSDLPDSQGQRNVQLLMDVLSESEKLGISFQLVGTRNLTNALRALKKRWICRYFHLSMTPKQQPKAFLYLRGLQEACIPQHPQTHPYWGSK